MHAIVLARRDFREYDQIVSLYTREIGKLELLARGVKKITSKNSPSLEPPSFISFETANGKDFSRITYAYGESVFPRIRSELRRYRAALMAVKLVNLLTKEKDADKRIFDALFIFLESVETSDSFDFALTLDNFAIDLLRCIGFAPMLNHCVVCGGNMGLNFFSPSLGGCLCKICSKNSLEDLFSFPSHKAIFAFLKYHTAVITEDWRLI